MGVIPMLVFPVCWDDEMLMKYKMLLINMLCICWPG